MQPCEFKFDSKFAVEILFLNSTLDNKKMSNTTKINFRQKQILAEFMSEHSNLAKGVLPNTCQGKATANRLCETLTNKLNASGPPLKDVKTWRKVYADQKQMVKKKLSYNKSSRKKTGGGPFEEKPLSATDEQILEAAGIDVAVAGLKEVRTFGSQNQQHEEINVNNTAPSQESDDLIIQLMDMVEEEDTPKKNVLVRQDSSSSRKEPRETKTVLLKKNICVTETYHNEVLKRLDQIIAIKEKKMEMSSKLHQINMEIKRTELKIRIKELEQLEKNSFPIQNL